MPAMSLTTRVAFTETPSRAARIPRDAGLGGLAPDRCWLVDPWSHSDDSTRRETRPVGEPTTPRRPPVRARTGTATPPRTFPRENSMGHSEQANRSPGGNLPVGEFCNL